MSGLEGYSPPLPTTRMKRKVDAMWGRGWCMQIRFSWAGWVGEGLFTTYMHTWMRMPRWQPDAHFPCPHLPARLLWRLLPGQGPPRESFTRQNTFQSTAAFPRGTCVSGCSSLCGMRGLSLLKCLLTTQAALLPSLSLLLRAIYWAQGIPDWGSGGATKNKTDKLSAFLEFMLWLKSQITPKHINTVQLWSQQEGLFWIGWSGKTPPQGSDI